MPNEEISSTFGRVIFGGILLAAVVGGLGFGYLSVRAEREQGSLQSTYRQCLSKFDYNRNGFLETNEVADLTKHLSTLPDVPRSR